MPAPSNAHRRTIPRGVYAADPRPGTGWHCLGLEREWTRWYHPRSHAQVLSSVEVVDPDIGPEWYVSVTVESRFGVALRADGDVVSMVLRDFGMIDAVEFYDAKRGAARHFYQLASQPPDLEHPPAPPTVVDEGALEGEGAPLARAEVEDVAGHEHAATLDGRDTDGHKHMDEGTEFSSGNSRGLMVGHGGVTPGRLDSRGACLLPASPSSHPGCPSKEGGPARAVVDFSSGDSRGLELGHRGTPVFGSDRGAVVTPRDHLPDTERVPERRGGPSLETDAANIRSLYAEARRLYDELQTLTQRTELLRSPKSDCLQTSMAVRAQTHLEVALSNLWIATCVLELDTLTTLPSEAEAGGTEA